MAQLQERIRQLEGSEAQLNTADPGYLAAKTALLNNPTEANVDRLITFVQNDQHTDLAKQFLMDVIPRRAPRPTANGAPDDNSPTLQVTPKSFRTLKSESDIVGARREKLELFQQFTMPISRPSYYINSLNNRMLLYGPPGTGKTLFANATANTMKSLLADTELFYFSEPTGAYKGKLVGQTEQNLREIFRVADNYARTGTKEGRGDPIEGRSVIFMDEFESLARSREDDTSASNRASVPELLQLLGDETRLEKLVFVAATNLPWELDSAILRRFDVRLFVDLPTQSTRRLIAYSIMRTRFRANVTDVQMCGDPERDWNNQCSDGVDVLVGMTGFRQEFFAGLVNTIQRLGAPISRGLYDAWLAEHQTDVSDLSLGIAYSNSDMTKIVNRAINIYAGDVLAYETYITATGRSEQNADARQFIEALSEEEPADNGQTLLAKRARNRSVVTEYQKRTRVRNLDKDLPFDYLLPSSFETHPNRSVFFLDDLAAYFRQAFLDYPPTVDVREYTNLIIYYFTNKNPIELEKSA